MYPYDRKVLFKSSVYDFTECLINESVKKLAGDAQHSVFTLNLRLHRVLLPHWQPLLRFSL